MFTGSIFLNLQKVLLCMAPYLQHQMGASNENGSAIESIDNEQIEAYAVMGKRASANEEIQANCIFFNVVTLRKDHKHGKTFSYLLISICLN